MNPIALNLSNASIVKKEHIDIDALQAILKHDGISHDEKKQLSKYHKRRVNGNVFEVKYNFSKDYPLPIGRMFPEKSSGLTAFPRDTRNALAGKYYHDVDMCNAQPAIALSVCKQRGWTHQYIEEYYKNTKKIRAETAAHYNVDPLFAKELYITIMFGGTIKQWRKDNKVDENIEDMSFLKGFKKDVDALRENIYSTESDIKKVVDRKKSFDDKKKQRSVLALFLQTKENEILMMIDDFMKQNGRSMDVLIFDGGLIRKLDREKEFPQELLRKCEEHIEKKSGLSIRLEVKEMKTSLNLNKKDESFVPEDVVVDDSYAADVFANLMKGEIVSVNGELFVFKRDTGMWTNDKNDILECVKRHEEKLKFKQLNAMGEISMTNYGGSVTKIRNMLELVPRLCQDNMFFIKNIDSSRGKLLFSDGIFDFYTNTFTPGFDPKIVFKHRITRPFPAERNEELIAQVRKELFEDPFMDDEKEAGVFLGIAIARALVWDYLSKRFYFCTGVSNAGKGVMSDAITACFENFIGAFNGDDLMRNTGGTDSAKKNAWMVPICDTRMSISNEMSMEAPLDGNIIKMAASGGDTIKARQNFKDAHDLTMRSTLFVFCNDIPQITPKDDAVTNRVFTIEYKCTFVDEPKEPHERKADPTIKDRYKKEDKVKDSVFHVLCDFYQLFLRVGHEPPECVKLSTQEWTGDDSSVKSLIEREYEITKCEEDFVSSDDINAYLERKGVKMSSKKVGTELKKMGLKSILKRIRSKPTRGWTGIKRDDVDYF